MSGADLAQTTSSDETPADSSDQDHDVDGEERRDAEELFFLEASGDHSRLSDSGFGISGSAAQLSRRARDGGELMSEGVVAS